VLITTRNLGCKVHVIVESYELDAMATNEAITLLLKIAKTNDVFNRSMRIAAKAIVRMLECLALAITQVEAMI